MKNRSKKFLIFAIIFALILSLTACGAAGTQNSGSGTESQQVDIMELPADGTEDSDVPEAIGEAVDLPEESESDGDSASTEGSEGKSQETLAESDVPEASQPYFVDIHFRNKKYLNEHYEKHGIEMGFENADEYEHAANLVINDPDVLHKTEKEDGDDVYYLEATNEFVVVSTDGYIRTYFWPNAGKKYFDKQ